MSDQTIEGQKKSVRNMFTRIAKRYDLANWVLSLGLHQRWRRRALDLTEVPHDGKLLDVASGTGDIALLARQRHSALRVVGLDLTPAMVKVAHEKDDAGVISWMISDGLTLPFVDNTFDAVISSFMMRNIPDISRALQEQYRVVRTGGRVICLEMTWPRSFPMSWLFRFYFFGWTPLVGRLISGDRTAYKYLPRSVFNFLPPQAMAKAMENVGLSAVCWKMMMMGTVAIHVGVK